MPRLIVFSVKTLFADHDDRLAEALHAAVENLVFISADQIGIHPVGEIDLYAADVAAHGKHA